MSMAELQALLAQTYGGNTVQAYVLAASVLLCVALGLSIIKSVMAARLRHISERTTTDVDDFLTNLLRHIDPPVYLLVGIYLGVQSLAMPGSLDRILHVVFVIVMTYKAVKIGRELMNFFLHKWAAKTELNDPMGAAAVSNMAKIIGVGLWLGGVIFVLDNLGINITSVVAGLGIGGIAVALAAQAMLGDAFSSFAIYMDKPFKVGDFIIVDDLLGTVEYIGFKTTRIRSLGGEQLVFSNTDLTSSRIRNYKLMRERRVVFSLGVTYQTTLEQIKAAPEIVKEIITSTTNTRFDRAHFCKYGDFALIIEVVYYVLSPDYNAYMDVQQAINVGIKEAFEARGLEFAYPTQQIYVTKTEPVSA